MKHILYRLWKCESGVALTELGIAAPFLLLMAVILTDAGRFQLWKSAVADSAHTGMMYGAIIGGPTLAISGNGTSVTISSADVEAAMMRNMDSLLGATTVSNASGTTKASFYCACSGSTAIQSPCLPSETMNCGSSYVLHYIAATATLQYKAIVPALYPAGATNLSVTRTAQILIP